MQILTHSTLPRRTFLRGLSAAIALPYLDAMEPAGRVFGRLSRGVPKATGHTRVVAIESRSTPRGR